jgi:GTP-binding protein
MMSLLPKVTIVGRPNVGKSSIFNQLTGHRIAIVSDIENTTRDIIEYHIDDTVNDISYILADSGGIVEADKETLLSDVHSRTDEAIERSDIILLVVEYNRLTEWDDYIIRRLRRSKKTVIILANKADNQKRALEAYEHLNIGLGEVVPMSAEQNRGFAELKTLIATELKKQGFSYVPNEVHDENLLKIAIIGRPNVGKSSLVNAMAGEVRSVVKDMP